MRYTPEPYPCTHPMHRERLPSGARIPARSPGSGLHGLPQAVHTVRGDPGRYTPLEPVA